MTASQAGRDLAAARRQVPRVCVVCGRPFVGTVRAAYDSLACKKAAYRARQRQRPPAPAGRR